MSDIVERAHRFAAYAHRDQKRIGGLPYIVHPEEVVSILYAHGEHRSFVLAAGYLHDVVEDCGVTLEEIIDEFGYPVADIVDRVSKRKGQPSDEYHGGIWLSWDATEVKLADRVSNIRGVMEKGAWKAQEYLRKTREQFVNAHYCLGLQQELWREVEILEAKVAEALAKEEAERKAHPVIYPDYYRADYPTQTRVAMQSESLPPLKLPFRVDW